MADIPIPAKEAHEALQALLDELAKVEISKLERQNKKNVKSTKPEEWVQALLTAQDEIEEWCPSFTMSLPLKGE